MTSYLEMYPKDHKKIEETATVGEAIRVKRKPPHHANTEHELEVNLNVLRPLCWISLKLLLFIFRV